MNAGYGTLTRCFVCVFFAHQNTLSLHQVPPQFALNAGDDKDDAADSMDIDQSQRTSNDNPVCLTSVTHDGDVTGIQVCVVPNVVSMGCSHVIVSVLGCR